MNYVDSKNKLQGKKRALRAQKRERETRKRLLGEGRG